MNRKNRGTIYLSGGGDEKKTKNIDSLFLDCLSGGKILFIPVAKSADINGYKKSYKWVTSKLMNISNSGIEVSLGLNLRDCKNLENFSAIYIGGGNTYKLLHNFKETGFSQALIKYLENGGVVYGASAGAVLLGNDISTYIEEKYATENQKKKYFDSKGLGLIGEYSILTHFHNSDYCKIKEYFSKKEDPIIAIAEGGAIVVKNGFFMPTIHQAMIFDKNRGSRKINVNTKVRI